MNITDLLTGLMHEICLNLTDDFPRLLYADELERLGGSVVCDECEGTGKHTRDNNGNVWQSECSTCHGTGQASDGFAERAEYIRTQIAISNLCRLHREGKATKSDTEKQTQLIIREGKLFRHAADSMLS